MRRRNTPTAISSKGRLSPMRAGWSGERAGHEHDAAHEQRRDLYLPGSPGGLVDAGRVEVPFGDRHADGYEEPDDHGRGCASYAPSGRNSESPAISNPRSTPSVPPITEVAIAASTPRRGVLDGSRLA
jgi:hypothetical protein